MLAYAGCSIEDRRREACSIETRKEREVEVEASRGVTDPPKTAEEAPSRDASRMI